MESCLPSVQMPTFRLTLAYDGTDFVGWQRQPKRRTIQEELEAAVSGESPAADHVLASGGPTPACMPWARS